MDSYFMINNFWEGASLLVSFLLGVSAMLFAIDRGWID